MELSGNGADSDPLLFVYGSLKRGMANHGQLQQAAWVGRTRLDGLALYDLGPFPMAIACSEPGSAIEGELYRVNAALLEQLDRFEGAPRLYQRELHRLNSGEAVWVYVGRARQVRHMKRLSSGCWKGPAAAFSSGRPARY
ncbi:gamma-glutamylcyclotransferase family protein [Vulcanococcus sp.]|uniref:gamma-glutamylcyclotransferase family protein n=1 Tax=Vulcanococcus sp. TaxID=2856995 RepID=UPI0025F3A5E4|nr:gamma-glutamylcyclotransferase family protein [Vulcanococcus sp.]